MLCLFHSYLFACLIKIIKLVGLKVMKIHPSSYTLFSLWYPLPLSLHHPLPPWYLFWLLFLKPHLTSLLHSSSSSSLSCAFPFIIQVNLIKAIRVSFFFRPFLLTHKQTLLWLDQLFFKAGQTHWPLRQREINRKDNLFFITLHLFGAFVFLF